MLTRIVDPSGDLLAKDDVDPDQLESLTKLFDRHGYYTGEPGADLEPKWVSLTAEGDQLVFEIGVGP